MEARQDHLPGTDGNGAKPDVAQRVAGNSRSWWRNSGMRLNSVLMIKWADQMGMPRLA